MFCGNVAKKNPKNPSRNRIGYVRTLPFRNSVLNICNERKDDWTEEVRMRTMSYSDLVVAEALYHYNCYQNISVSLEKEPMQKPSSGRPIVKDFEEKFNLLCEWLESEMELYSLTEFHEKMKELSGSEDVYTTKWLKARLKNKCEDHIYFVEVNGKNNVVCFKDIAMIHGTI